MNKLEKSKKKMPLKPAQSIQFDLFSQFISNDDTKFSNTVELWESIPKYFFTPSQIKKLRTDDGLAQPFKWDYLYNNSPCSVKIQPALIEQKDGSYAAFFPSSTEELVEEALKKIFTDQNFGIHHPDKTESWVRFSLSAIHKELKARGRSRDRNSIKHAIEVMSGCIITLSSNGKEVWKGSILQDLTTVGRDEYLADTNTHHIARLPLFISQGINNLGYRQFNYDRLMSCSEQLTRWIYKKLINRFKQASLMNDYNLMYSNIYQSGLLQQQNDAKNRRKIKKSLDELVKQKILSQYDDSDVRKNGRTIVEVKYILQPSREFIGEQKSANKRQTVATKKLSKISK